MITQKKLTHRQSCLSRRHLCISRRRNGCSHGGRGQDTTHLSPFYRKTCCMDLRPDLCCQRCLILPQCGMVRSTTSSLSWAQEYSRRWSPCTTWNTGKFFMHNNYCCFKRTSSISFKCSERFVDIGSPEYCKYSPICIISDAVGTSLQT